jgi:hypothetical protein
MDANTSTAAHAAAQASSGATNATATGRMALRVKLGRFHPGTATGKAAAAGAGAGSTAPGGGSGALSGHAAVVAPAHAGIRTWFPAHVGMKPPVALALKTSLMAKSLAVASAGVVGVVVAAHTGVLPAAQIGLSAVPTWSSGSSLVAHLQAGLGLRGSGGLWVGL